MRSPKNSDDKTCVALIAPTAAPTTISTTSAIGIFLRDQVGVMDEQDLTLYEKHLTELGVYTADHLQDLNDDMLNQLGMKPLVLKRFIRQLQTQYDWGNAELR